MDRNGRDNVMNTSVEDLESIVSDTIRGGALAKDIQEVRVEPGVDADGNEILRVLVQMKREQEDTDEELESLLEKIEAAILEIDERYPSVRFLDAA